MVIRQRRECELECVTKRKIADSAAAESHEITWNPQNPSENQLIPKIRTIWNHIESVKSHRIF
jgi:hypothetical protein